MRKALGRLGSNAQKRQSKSRERFFGNREPWRAPHRAGQYRFIIAVWRAKEAESTRRKLYRCERKGGVGKIIPLRASDVSQDLLHSISNSLYPFVVGLIHRDDLVVSGTLVRLGDRQGILTAYHVVHNVVPKFDFRAGSQDSLGLIILPHERVHRFEIPLGVGITTVIDIAKPTVEELGPDLAFIEIKPSHHLDQLEACRDFFNLGVNREKGLRMDLGEKDPMVISGFCHEGHTLERDKDGFSLMKGFKGFAGFTIIEN